MNYDRFSLAYPPRHINNAVKTVRHNGPDGECAIITTENLFRGHLTNQTNLIRSAVNVVRTAFRRINVWSFRYLHFFFIVAAPEPARIRREIMGHTVLLTHLRFFMGPRLFYELLCHGFIHCNTLA